jgi:hypothetical protein
MHPLEEILKRAIDEFAEAHRTECLAKLDKIDDLSLHESYVLGELGSREQWYPELLRLGAAALALAQDLSGDDWESNYIMQDAVDPAEPFFGIPMRGLELAAVRQFVYALPVVRARATEIVWSALNAHPSLRVRAYMRRLGRCYIAGFDAEVVMLCRSILDTALRDVAGDGPAGPTNLYGRIELLRDREQLSSDLVAAAP